jgi:quinoprotein glucose dehydrogenase
MSFAYRHGMAPFLRHLIVVLLVLLSGDGMAQTTGPVVVPKDLELSLWAREPMLKNPVALSFDNNERLYVVETARRSTVDIDIRSHRPWLIDDLSNQSIDDLRRFFRSKMAPEKSAENARWLTDRNGDGSHDWRDLMEVRERVHWLEDSTGDGKADRAQMFAEGFNEEINGVMAGVLPWEDQVWVTVYPDLWRLQDRDGDGIAEVQESVFRGFGVHASFDGHDLHGLTIGPDGKLYFSIGDNGFSVVTREGRRLHHPNTGGVLRMNTDGTQLEVFALGLRNVQEIAFDEYGNLFSVDNDGDLADERERFVYIVEGSDSGWRTNWQFRDRGWSKVTEQPDYNPWIAERMWIPHWDGQPAYITPPLSNYSVGPSGFKYNPGTSINGAYKRHFFLAQFPVNKITAFQVQPKGASFEMTGEHVFLSGMMASALNFSPSGAMFIADWDGMWSPNEKGAIYKLDDPRETGSPIRREVRRLLKDGVKSRPLPELRELLGHEDMRIRQLAQFEIVRRADATPLLATAIDTAAPQLARVHALWGLAQLKPKGSVSKIPFRDPDAEIRAQTARLAGELGDTAATTALLTLLSDPSPRVQFHAAMSLGKLHARTAFDPIVRMLDANRNQDAFIRHATVMALVGIGDVEALSGLTSHPSNHVRAGAVVALRRLQSPALTRYLHDPNLWVRREAVRAIHDDFSVPEALPELAALLDEPDLPDDEAIVRRAISANPLRLVRFSLDPSPSEPMRIEALESLGAWNRTPYVDRVEGRIRTVPMRHPTLGDELIQKNLGNLLQTPIPSLTEALTRILTRNGVETDPSVFADWVAAPLQPVSLRIQSLRLLAKLKADQLDGAVQSALTAEPVALRQAGLEVMADSQPESFARYIQSPTPFSIPELQTAVRLAARTRQAEPFLLLNVNSLLNGSLPKELELDVTEAARVNPSQTMAARSKLLQARIDPNDPLAPFRSALHGGDPIRGLEIFKTHAAGQCVRCHEAGGEGRQVGPVLTGIADRATPEYLLESVVTPSARLAPGFESVSLSTTDGETVDGILVKDSGGSVTLRLASGELLTVTHQQIEERSTSKVSAMPAMTDVLTPFEIRDVVAYLTTLKK